MLAQFKRDFLAVTDAGWLAAYDIRADMDSKEPPITLTYKAIITQNTGEVRIPLLRPWSLNNAIGMERYTPYVGNFQPLVWHRCS